MPSNTGKPQRYSATTSCVYVDRKTQVAHVCSVTAIAWVGKERARRGIVRSVPVRLGTPVNERLVPIRFQEDDAARTEILVDKQAKASIIATLVRHIGKRRNITSWLLGRRDLLLTVFTTGAYVVALGIAAAGPGLSGHNLGILPLSNLTDPFVIRAVDTVFAVAVVLPVLFALWRLPWKEVSQIGGWRTLRQRFLTSTESAAATLSALLTARMLHVEWEIEAEHLSELAALHPSLPIDVAGPSLGLPMALTGLVATANALRVDHRLPALWVADLEGLLRQTLSSGAIMSSGRILGVGGEEAKSGAAVDWWRDRRDRRTRPLLVFPELSRPNFLDALEVTLANGVEDDPRWDGLLSRTFGRLKGFMIRLFGSRVPSFGPDSERQLKRRSHQHDDEYSIYTARSVWLPRWSGSWLM